MATPSATPRVVSYKAGSYSIVPKKYTVGRKIAVRGYQEKNKTETSDRTFKAQKHWFGAPPNRQFSRDFQQLNFDFYNLETKLIWKAFDTPELIGILLHDEAINGSPQVYSDEFLKAAEHWIQESRYWRCIGISKPFYNRNTLRAHCWEENGQQTGTLRLSQAMRHALMDLERAHKRREMGLDPNYLWDNWGPQGFLDGSRADFLPRFEFNPYLDPDGVEITDLDVAPFNTHEQIRERYSPFIFQDTTPFEGCFLSIGHGHLTLEDIGKQDVIALYSSLNAARIGKRPLHTVVPDPSDMRTLMYLAADPELMNQLGDVKTWSDVTEKLNALRSENDAKVDAARLLDNTRHDATRVRRFFEEKCGFHDFMNTSDKNITAAALCFVRSMRQTLSSNEWGSDLATAFTDLEKFSVMGPSAFRVFRLTEDLILDKRRRTWATRFAGEANEEATLDYLLENFGKRTERPKNVGSTGAEFDRELEPIGRQVQRRVLDSDKQSNLAEARKSKGRVFKYKADAFAGLHAKQMQNTNRAIR